MWDLIVSVPDHCSSFYFFFFFFFFFNLDTTLCVKFVKQTNTLTLKSVVLICFILTLTMHFTYACFFPYSPLYPSLKVTFHFSVHGPECQYDIENNNFIKRLENTQKFAFDFVAFLVSLSIHSLAFLLDFSHPH